MTGRKTPTAENSGMKKNSILKYVFFKRTSNNPTDSSDHKPVLTAGARKLMITDSEMNNESNDESCSSDSSNPSISAHSGASSSRNGQGQSSSASANVTNESQSSLPRITVNESIFENSVGNNPEQSTSQPRVDVNGNDRCSGNGANATDEAGDDEFTVPRILNVQSIRNQKNGPKKQTQNRTKEGPTTSKKRKSSDDSGSSSSAESSTSSSSSKKPKIVMSKELETLIEKKRWEAAIPQLIANMNQDLFPTDMVLAQVINDCILKCRRTSAKANELMEKIVSTNKNVDSYEFVVQAIASVSAELAESDRDPNYMSNSYWPFVRELIQALTLNAKANCGQDGNHALRFVTALVTLLERLFELHANSTIHLHAPMVVRLFEGISFDETPPVRLQNLRNNVAQLTHSLVELQNFDVELSVLTRLLNLLARHYYGHRIRRPSKEALIEQFSSVLAEAKNYGIRVLGKLEGNFGRDVCVNIVEKQLEELSDFSDKSKFLTCLVKSKFVRKHHTESAQFHLTENMCSLTKATNSAGESVLHRLCGDPKKQEKLVMNLKEALKKIEESPAGTVNIPDNGNNFPLHDAADNGRVDQLQILLKHCGPDQVNERMRLNPLLRNTNGDTPLHLAVKKGNLKAVKILIKIIGEQEKVELNLDMSNNAGVTPMNSSNNVQINDYLRSLHPDTPSWEENFCFPECKVRLSPESVAKLKADNFLQQVVYQFNRFIK